MKVIFLDVLDEEELNLDEIDSMPYVEITDDPSVAEVVCVSWSEVTIKDFPNMRALINRSMGTDHISESISTQTFFDRPNIIVHHIGDYCSREVADYVIDKIAGDNVKLLIVGMGRIGYALYKKSKGRYDDVLTLHHDSPENEMKHKLSEATHISLHLPLTADSLFWFDLDKMMECNGAVLINTSRGKVVRTQDLIKAIKLGKISEAYLDVVYRRRLISDNLKIKYTRHSAWLSERSVKLRKKMVFNALEEVAYALGVDTE